ncbi:MAG: CHC2 zinc finger domain-containing protein [Candidatus Saganbacteria bacterium]|nr:CHC2 zinc finger domain-containing protein [Candidatus Saganbacteria bacterium]
MDTVPQQIIEKINGLKVIEDYGVKLKISGKQYSGLCPFHNDQRPSFSYNDKDKLFYCHSCRSGGNIIQFVAKKEGITYREAQNRLALKYGVKTKELSQKEIEEYDRRQRVLEVKTAAAYYYHNLLMYDPAGEKYKKHLNNHYGLTDDTLKTFLVGVALQGNLLFKHLLGNGYEEELIVESAVVKRMADASLKDYFAFRIIFPFVQADGLVESFTGRATEETPRYERDDKYRQLPGQKPLYNVKAIKETRVVIVEGPTDCLAFYQNGYHATALVGVSLPEKMEKKINSAEVIICLDGDKAGRDAALNIAERLMEKAAIIQLPDDIDPNEYLKTHGKSDFDVLLGSAKDYISTVLDSIPANANKKQLNQALKATVLKMAKLNNVDVELFLKKMKEQFELTSHEVEAYRKMVKHAKKEAINEGKESANGQITKEYSAAFEGLVDIVSDGGATAFLIKEEEELSIVKEIEKDGKLLIPPSKEQLPWLLPRGKAVMHIYEHLRQMNEEDRKSAIYEELLAYHKNISELPDEGYYDLLAAWVLHTYFMESFQYSPIICLYAVPERGKTRTAKGLVNIAYRGVTLVTLGEANIFRLAQNCNASLFFDVMDIWKKAERAGAEDVLLGRYERGQIVSRVIYPEKGKFEDTKHFCVFGPTLIATNIEPHKILGTRAITITMPESKRQFENEVIPELSLPLKEKLVACRALYLNCVLDPIEKAANGRLGDILKPLHQIVRYFSPKNEEMFLMLVEKLTEKKLLAKAESIEAEILCAIRDLEPFVKNTKVSVIEITDRVNLHRDDRSKLNPKTVGRRLNSLGFDKGRTGNGSSAIIWDTVKLEGMLTSYGLDITPETSETSETSGEAF